MVKASFKPASKAEAPKPRKVVDQQAQLSRAIAGHPAAYDPAEDEPKVLVNVPRPFKLTDDGHILHNYTSGQQLMPKSHAEHFYAVAHGVTLVDPQLSAD